MTVKVYGPRRKDRELYVWEPEDDYSWFDNVGYQWSENFFGQTGRYLARRRRREEGTGTSFDALRDRTVLEQHVGRVSQQEIYKVMQQEVTDFDEAILSIRQEREAQERRERFREANPSMLGTMAAGVVADLPLLLAELAVFRSSGSLLRYMHAPRIMRGAAARDVLSVGAVEFGSNAAIAAISVEDTVEDAIVNGTLGTVFGAAMVGGVEGVRVGWGKYKTGKRMKDDVPLGAASEIPSSGPC